MRSAALKKQDYNQPGSNEPAMITPSRVERFKLVSIRTPQTAPIAQPTEQAGTDLSDFAEKYGLLGFA